MTLYSTFISPFIEYGFMRRALVGCFALALGFCAMHGLSDDGGTR